MAMDKSSKKPLDTEDDRLQAVCDALHEAGVHPDVINAAVDSVYRLDELHVREVTAAINETLEQSGIRELPNGFYALLPAAPLRGDNAFDLTLSNGRRRVTYTVTVSRKEEEEA